MPNFKYWNLIQILMESLSMILAVQKFRCLELAVKACINIYCWKEKESVMYPKRIVGSIIKV